jgi:DNA-binding XRE family transcriptional regulator
MIKTKKKKVRSLSLLASELLGYSKLAAKELQDQCDDTLLGAHLERLRCDTGLTQADVAKRMGVTQSTVSRLEDSRWQDMKLGELDAYLKAMKGN